MFLPLLIAFTGGHSRRQMLASLLMPAVLLVVPMSSCGAAASVPVNHPTPRSPAGYAVISLGRGHLNRLCLAATIEGIKGLMIVDTGANHSALSDKYASLLPGPTRKLPAGVPLVANVNGRSCKVGVARDFHVGNTDLGTVAIPLLQRRLLYEQSTHDRQYDGLMGEDLLRRYRAILDCGRLALYLITNPNQKLNLGPALTQAGWTRVPLSDLQNDFVVPCEINGEHFRIIVDTGAPFTLMDRGMLASAHTSVSSIPMRGGIIGTRAEQMGFVKLPRAAIGSYTATDLQVVADSSSARYFQDAANDQTNGKVLGLLGGSFLAANNAIIDIGGKALYLKPGKAAR